MKAAVCTKYGPPEVLEIHELNRPIAGPDQVLVRVVASAVNSGDVRVRGLAVDGFLKIIMQVVLGFTRPRRPVLGTVFSGVVEEVGRNVSKFREGDKVFGMTGFKFGTHAEYVAVGQDSAVLAMPVNASFEEAAALVFGGQTAIHFLDKAGIAARTNAKVLVIGATGAVGVAAVQIARYYGAEVTAVCSERGAALAGSLGAVHVIDYEKEDLSGHAGRYDVVFDAVGKCSPAVCKKLLNPNGVYKTVSRGYASETLGQLQLMKQLFESGHFKAVIDKVFTLDEIVAAHAYVDTGRKKGSVVLKVSDPVLKA